MPKKKSKKAVSEVPSPATVLLLFGTIADTTWRLFVPTLLGVIIGLMIDNYFETKPWFTITGVLIGAFLAFELVYLQMKGMKK